MWVSCLKPPAPKEDTFLDLKFVIGILIYKGGIIAISLNAPSHYQTPDLANHPATLVNVLQWY